jgi:GcrA cell cycle regulator
MRRDRAASAGSPANGIDVGSFHFLRSVAPRGGNTGDRDMLWTEEAIEVLKRLALEGRSASVIALALGAASRNAVIGKANRIGIRLNGDGRAWAPAGAPSGAVSRPGRSAQAFLPREERKAWTFAEAEVGEMRRVRFEDIRRSECRWPLGDPRSGDFAYCGLAPVEGHSYCAGHCRMAYRPPESRQKLRPLSGRGGESRAFTGGAS